MVVIQVGLVPPLNIVTVCGMRMHAKHEQSKNHMHLPYKTRLRCYAKSPTAQDAFRTIPDLMTCAGVTGSMQEIDLICH